MPTSAKPGSFGTCNLTRRSSGRRCGPRASRSSRAPLNSLVRLHENHRGSFLRASFGVGDRSQLYAGRRLMHHVNSGGVARASFGARWARGSRSHLNFVPEPRVAPRPSRDFPPSQVVPVAKSYANIGKTRELRHLQSNKAFERTSLRAWRFALVPRAAQLAR